jgi:hypothetical protein
MEEYLIISFFVSISFFIIKLVLNKMQKDEKTEKNSDVMKDSIYVFIITFLVIYAYSNFFKKSSDKTPVFTNEPGF